MRCFKIVIVLCVLCFTSFITAFGHDEGTIDPIIGEIGTIIFMIFRFPFFYIEEMLGEHTLTGPWFFMALFANTIIICFVVCIMTKGLSKLVSR